MISGATVAAIIAVLAALVLALRALDFRQLEFRQGIRLALIWAGIFGVLFLVVGRFLG